MEVKVEVNDVRIDKYLSDELDLSRSKIAKLIKEEKILVNGKVVSASYKVKQDDIVTVNDELDFSIDIEKENIPIDIVYEDEDMLIINKESGMVVHPAPGHYTGTLVNALLYKFDLEGDSIRPGIVHRLDKDTSGLMMVAKNEKMHDILSKMIKDKEVKRCYVALVEGIINHDTGTIDAPIGRDKYDRQKQAIDENGKEAITHFKVVKKYKDATLVECKLETGRTHQIRVHMKYIGHPIVNDPVYNKKSSNSFGQMLHSKSIEFIHPKTKEKIFFEVEPPKEFMDILKSYEND